MYVYPMLYFDHVDKKTYCILENMTFFYGEGVRI